MIDTGDPAFTAWLSAATKIIRLDLWTIITRAGELMRFSGGDVDVTLPDGRVFVRGPGFQRSRIRLSAGLKVDKLDVKLFVTAANLVGAVPMAHHASAGGLDGARVDLEWAYFDEAAAYKGRVRKFSGLAGPAEIEPGIIRLEVRSELARLQMMLPKEVYQPACLNQVYDTRCGLSKATWAVSGTVTGVDGGRVWLQSAVSAAADYFNLGTLAFTTGANAGSARTVKGFASGAFQFALPTLFPIEVGDEFTVRPGCDRSLGTCTSKFNNRIRFRGMPFVPAPETVA